MTTDHIAIVDALLMMEIVNNPPTGLPTDERERAQRVIDEENRQRFSVFLNAMIELGKKLRGEPTDATFVKGGNEEEIEYMGLMPLPGGGFDSGYFQVSVTLLSTRPGTSGVRKKPPRGRLKIQHIFASVATLDARRFNRCKVCDNIFYAKRLDAVCCSRQHATQYRTNQFRSRRKENYHYKKLRGEK